MATEILVNDGGAPARIIKFEAGEALTAGDAVAALHVASGDCTVVKADSSEATNLSFVGVALTDVAAAGDIASIVTGRGVVCRINCTDVNGGLMVAVGNTGGQLEVYSDGTDLTDNPVAVTLEDGALGGGGAGLIKCLIL
tara:strand:- start:1716 stop:2135 length:420 start_codon:yes stop_codon:yes gene_type:complete